MRIATNTMEAATLKFFCPAVIGFAASLVEVIGFAASLVEEIKDIKEIFLLPLRSTFCYFCHFCGTISISCG